MAPRVSICLPSLNTFPFLQARKESILSQALNDWELIIVDDGSTDGSWQFFEEWQQEDSRVKLFRGPGQGLYPGWNDAIRRANADLVYIATSDDTMAPNCLEQLADALSQHPEFGIAHCNLRTIDQDGNDTQCEWYDDGPFIKSSGDLAGKKHFRFAPFDGMLHLTGASVYASITQLMIRREVFSRVGLFEARWGSMADFNWNMRATLVASTIHVPDTWGGWRVHADSATNQSNKEGFYQDVQEMIDHAIASSLDALPKEVRRDLPGSWARFFNDRRDWWKGGDRSKLHRYTYVMKKVATGDPVAWEFCKWRLGIDNHFETDPVELIKIWHRKSGLASPLSCQANEPAHSTL